MTKDELSELTAEKTLYDVYRKVVRRLPNRPVYRLLVVVIFVLVLAAALLCDVPITTLSKLTRDWSSGIFNFAGTVLGILLAGFTIFSTLAGTDLVGPLARFKEKQSNLSYLKYTAGHFMHVFIWYVLFLFVYALVMFFGWEGGPATLFARWLAATSGASAARFATALGTAFIGAFFAQLIIVLQSFVFNVYASFMFMVRGKLELDEVKARRNSGGGAAGDADEAAERMMKAQAVATGGESDVGQDVLHHGAPSRAAR